MINGRLGEIFFDWKRGKPVILGHGYVKRSEYKTTREKRMIKADTNAVHLTYRHKKYRDQDTGKEIPLGKLGHRMS